MPVLSPIFASAEEVTTTSATFVAAAQSSALTNGVEYLVLVTAGSLAPSSNSTTAEIEVDFGGTQYAISRFQGPTNFAPDSATGASIQAMFTVTGDGTSVLEVNHRAEVGGGTVQTSAHIVAIPLTSLASGVDYHLSETDTTAALTNPTAGSGWATSGASVQFTPDETGDWLIIASLEGEFTTGNTATDQMRMRVLATEDPLGTPSTFNLMNNSGTHDGPETQLEGGSDADVAASQRFIDVQSLTGGTTYDFDVQYEGVAATANTGYRRGRIIALDLAAWPELTYFRTVEGVATQDALIGNASAPAPDSSLDYLLLSAVAHQNNNSFIRTYFDTDPTGAGNRVPTTGAFGAPVVDTGNSVLDDYILIGTQWDVQGVTGAQTVALQVLADNNTCRWGPAHGVFPGATPNTNGVATLLLVWGMETADSPGALAGGISSSSSVSGTLAGVGALEASVAGISTASGTLTGVGALEGTSAGSSIASAAPAIGAISGTAAGASTVLGSLVTSYWNSSVNVAFVGNSYTQNYNSLPSALDYYLGQRLPGWSGTLGPPAYLATSINSSTDGYFPGMSLGGMTLFPTYNQDQTGGIGTTDATNAVIADGPFDFVVLTSGFRQEGEVPPTVEYELLDGAGGTNVNVYGVILNTVRLASDELTAGGSTAPIVLFMTQEGFNANDNSDLDDVERVTRLQVLGARQLEREGEVDRTVPIHYVWARLQWGAFGNVGSGVTSPVAAYSTLTHDNSSQPGNANLAWLNRSQGDTAPFNTNGHQNIIATIVHVWTYGYAMFGIDPRGDTTFDSPTGLPQPFDDFISPDGTRIYGGHNTGLGNNPYDTGINPSGPPDSQLDLDWNATVRGQIQDIVVAAVDDYYAQETEWDTMFLVGSADGSSVASATASAVGVLAGVITSGTTSVGDLTALSTLSGAVVTTSTVAGGLTASVALEGVSTGSSTATATPTTTVQISGTAAGSSTAVAAPTTIVQISGTATGSTTLTGDLSNVGVLVGALAGVTTLTGLITGFAFVVGPVSSNSTTGGTLTAVANASGTASGSTVASASPGNTFNFGPPLVLSLPIEIVKVIRLPQS